MKMSNRTKRNRAAGFSLIELLVVVVILMVIMGVVLSVISDVQKRARTQETHLDQFQTAREFLDQMIRDIHQIGFPNAKMYNPGSLGGAPETDQRNAVGLVFISPTSVQFEGDIDGDGFVDEVFYTLVGQNNGPGTQNCPCIRRSVLQKSQGASPTAAVPQYQTQVENVRAPAANEPPIFVFYKQDGEIYDPGPGGYTRTIWDPQNMNEAMNQIWSVQIRLDIQQRTRDLGTRRRLEAVLTAAAQINN